ncbi:MAG: glycoside hydrolase family 9 protein [Lachnospiraceae bacterium]|jgi:endoglucanase|nr:glycoside hydrolase family 9 protein [Lachnospiraceae bacterium]
MKIEEYPVMQKFTTTIQTIGIFSKRFGMSNHAGHLIRFFWAFWWVWVSASFLTACTKPIEIPEPVEIPEERLSMEDEPIIEYEVPTMAASIFVNREGYDRYGDKIAIVNGESFLSPFRVVNAVTREIVFTGNLQEGSYPIDNDEYNSYGDFSAVTLEGIYYIECDHMGRSYPFRIFEGETDRVFDNVIDMVGDFSTAMKSDGVRLQGSSNDDTLRALYLYLLSYELFPTVFQDEVSSKVPKILQAATRIVTTLTEQSDPDTGALGVRSYFYAAILAKYSYLYQSYDDDYATVVLNYADKAWRYAQKQRSKDATQGIDEEFRILAAAEMYRATGRYTYRNVFLEYGKQYLAEAKAQAQNPSTVEILSEAEDDARGDYNVSNFAITMAKVTYLLTKQRVNAQLCDLFMSQLMENAERIVSEADLTHPTRGFSTFTQADATFWDMTLLTVVGYAVRTQGYEKVAQELYHYLCGRNPSATRYFTADGDVENEPPSDTLSDTPQPTSMQEALQIGNNETYLAYFTLMMSQIIGTQAI